MDLSIKILGARQTTLNNYVVLVKDYRPLIP